MFQQVEENVCVSKCGDVKFIDAREINVWNESKVRLIIRGNELLISNGGREWKIAKMDQVCCFLIQVQMTI